MSDSSRQNVLVATALLRPEGVALSSGILKTGYALPSLTLNRTYMIHIAEWSHAEFELRDGVSDLLVFVSVFNDDTFDYIAAFGTQLPHRVDASFGGAVDWKPVRDNRRLIKYVTDHQHTTTSFYSAYPGVSVTDIDQALHTPRLPVHRPAKVATRLLARGPSRRVDRRREISYAVGSWRRQRWGSTTFVLRARDEGSVKPLEDSAWTDRALDALTRAVPGIHFASVTVANTVKVGRDDVKLARPHVILSVQHDGRASSLLELLSEHPVEMAPFTAIDDAFARAHDAPSLGATLRTRMARDCLTVNHYPRHDLPAVRRALDRRERVVERVEWAANRAPVLSMADRRITQGNIVEGYSTEFEHGAYVFMRVNPEEQERARRWIGALADRITTAEGPPRGPLTVNVGFSFKGLSALGVVADNLAWCSEPFTQGMAQRAEEKLDDRGLSAPAHWLHAARTADVFVALRSNDLDHLNRELQALLDSAHGEGFWHWFGDVERGRLILDEQGGKRVIREPFGFRDGISQPRIARRGEPLDANTIRLGEFLLGHEHEDGQPEPIEQPIDLYRNGSYLVYRKLHQNVRAFRRFLDDHADGSRDALAASLVGRTFDGEIPHALRTDDGAISYRKDPTGVLCPIGSHIRRANPMDSLDRHGARSRRHRLLRRGIPYLDPPDPAGQPAGLLFMAFCTHIDRQFEFVQRAWLNDGNVFGLPRQPDVFSGNEGMVVRAKPALRAELPLLVTVRDGAYFFVPSVEAVRRIGAGAYS